MAELTIQVSDELAQRLEPCSMVEEEKAIIVKLTSTGMAQTIIEIGCDRKTTVAKIKIIRMTI